LDGQKIKRDLLKKGLGCLLHWRPLREVRAGFSIVLGVPWILRHLLAVNLRFVERTNVDQLHRIHIVFDRVEQAESDVFLEQMRQQFPSLPLSFRFHPSVSGRLVEFINQSKFYASMNWTLGLAECETRYAILHDFDLYPLVPEYFSAIAAEMESSNLRFSGVEWTHFDGLESAHRLIGTWALALDVPWLRLTYQPIDCFHHVGVIAGRRFDLDAFSFIQSQTSARGLSEVISAENMTHVKNLVSTHLRFCKGEVFDVVWRLHQLWYLESLSSNNPSTLVVLADQMEKASSSKLLVQDRVADFAKTHVTCANVLRKELTRMEIFLFGVVRPEVLQYIDAFEEFLWRCGRSEMLMNSDGSVRWTPHGHQQSGLSMS
jgi:hypothetical protein